MTSLLDEVATRGQTLVLRGGPGIGKSRLLSEAARDARAPGMSVLTATGVQSEAHLPFAGLHQLLRPVRARAAVERAAQAYDDTPDARLAEQIFGPVDPQMLATMRTQTGEGVSLTVVTEHLGGFTRSQ